MLYVFVNRKIVVQISSSSINHWLIIRLSRFTHISCLELTSSKSALISNALVSNEFFYKRRKDPMNASLTNCEIRDKQFNDIYFLSNISYNICVCLAGFIGVQFGNVIVRITSFALCLVGLILTSFLETNEEVIWVSINY